MGYEPPFAYMTNGPGDEPPASGWVALDFERAGGVNLGDDPGLQTR